MSEPFQLADRIRALREELDLSFARPRAAEPEQLVGLLAVRVGDAPWALPIAEIEALVADRTIVRLPTAVRDLIGLCALRGAVVPVYDLAPLLGQAGNTAPRTRAPRWLAIARRRERVALAFDALEAQLQVSPAEIASSGGERAREAVIVHGAPRPLIRIASVLDAIEQRVRPPKEP